MGIVGFIGSVFITGLPVLRPLADAAGNAGVPFLDKTYQ